MDAFLPCSLDRPSAKASVAAFCLFARLLVAIRVIRSATAKPSLNSSTLVNSYKHQTPAYDLRRRDRHSTLPAFTRPRSFVPAPDLILIGSVAYSRWYWGSYLPLRVRCSSFILHDILDLDYQLFTLTTQHLPNIAPLSLHTCTTSTTGVDSCLLQGCLTPVFTKLLQPATL